MQTDKLITLFMHSTDSLCYIRLPSLHHHHHHQIRLDFFGFCFLRVGDYIHQDKEVPYLSISHST